MAGDRFVMMLIGPLALSACASLARTVHYERSGDFAMPDVSGKTAADAKDDLAKAGIVGDIDVRDEICHDEVNVPEQHVCYTAPRAGAMTRANLPVTIYVKQKATAFFEMPNLVGLTADQAKQKLVALGEQAELIEVETINSYPPPGCVGDHVCAQSPPAGDRTPANTAKLLQLGPAGWVDKSTTTTTTTTTATTGTPTPAGKDPPTSTTTAKPTTQPPPKKDDKPAPLF